MLPLSFVETNKALPARRHSQEHQRFCFVLWGSINFNQYEVYAASHLKGRKNQWADALWHQTTPSVEWALDCEVFLKLAQMYGHPKIDLLASRSNHRIKRFLTRTGDSRRRSRCFSERLEQMTVNIPVPPPLTIRLQVINRLRKYKGKVLLIAPLWEAQPWTRDLFTSVFILYLCQGRCFRELWWTISQNACIYTRGVSTCSITTSTIIEPC